MLALPVAVPHRTIAGLHLRALTRADAPIFRAIVTRPDVGRMLFAFPTDWPLDQAVALMDDNRHPITPPFRLAIAGPDSALMGSVGFAAGKSDEIAFFLHPDWAGQGVMGAALDVFLTQVFSAYDMKILRATVYHDNAASLAILTRLGFVITDSRMALCSAQRYAPEMLYTLVLSDADWHIRQ